MKIKTSELTGAALDWAVAKCEGYQAVFTDGTIRPVFRKAQAVEATWPEYSTNWEYGGPIIEREGITLDYDHYGPSRIWEAKHFAFDGTVLQQEYGPTPLIAAMRCYVASELGDTVDIPEELSK
jgi:hypothetical protein